VLLELLGHELRVPDADAESERAHASRVSDLVEQRSLQPTMTRRL
jgi:hypothetical protein